MNPIILHRYTLALALLLSLASIQASPIDLSDGYGDFKWGTSPEELYAAAQKKYGAENVVKQSCVVEGYPEEEIIVKEGKTSNRFKFFRGGFYYLDRRISVHFTGYYTQEDIDSADLGAQAKKLYSSSEGISISSVSKKTGEYGNRIMGVELQVSIFNKNIYDQKIKELRVESPDLATVLIEPLKKP